MGRYLSRLLKAMLISGIGFGGGTGLLFMILIIMFHNGPNKFYIAAKSGIGLGLVFGILLGIILSLLDLSARMYFAKGHYNEVWEMEQSREITMTGSPKEILAICREALLAVPYVKAVQEDAENLVARSSTGTSWRSAGESLEVEINPVSENEWLVRCTSKPIGLNIVFDYGKNFENVESWYSVVKHRKELESTKESA